MVMWYLGVQTPNLCSYCVLRRFVYFHRPLISRSKPVKLHAVLHYPRVGALIFRSG